MGQNKERRVQMKRTGQPNSGRSRCFALFLLIARFIHNGMTRCRLRVEACGTSERFSTWLARMGRRANLPQNAGHHPANLPWSDWTPFSFPRQQGVESQLTCQKQLDEGQGYHPTPSQKLVRSTHPHRCPEHLLFEKAKHMLLGE